MLQKYRLGDGGRQLSQTGTAGLRQAAAPTQATADILQLATAALLDVLPVSLRNAPDTLDVAQRLTLATHRKHPDDLLLLARALRADGRIDAAVAVANEGLKLLPALPPGSTAPRLNRMLQAAAGPVR